MARLVSGDGTTGDTELSGEEFTVRVGRSLRVVKADTWEERMAEQSAARAYRERSTALADLADEDVANRG